MEDREIEGGVVRQRFRRATGRFADTLVPRHPAQFVIWGFLVAVAISTVLLTLPVAAESDRSTSFLQALFTATSAVCVTGLSVVNMSEHWSTFGEVVVLVSVQFGGFGIMTSASLLGLLVSRQMGFRSRMLTATETRSLALGDVRRVVRGVAITMAIIELTVAAMLALRLWSEYDHSIPRALYSGLFHAVCAHNNAGFSLYNDSLVRFVEDPFIKVPIAVAVFLGSIGFPVIFELLREHSLHRWSLHTKLTLFGSAILLVGGTIAVTLFEWTNPRTLGPLSVTGKLLAGMFGGIMPRSGGFNSVDYSAMQETTWLVTDVLMFIGGGPAGTGGGIKVTTFMLLFFAILAEARGDSSVDAFSRRIPPAVLRQALSVALLGVAAVVFGTLIVLAVSDLDLDRVLFEVISAFGTVGLSTGITAALPPAGQYCLIVLMFIGRTGPVTLASALALRNRRKLYNLPEERPIVG